MLKMQFNVQNNLIYINKMSQIMNKYNIKIKSQHKNKNDNILYYMVYYQNNQKKYLSLNLKNIFKFYRFV